jgi:hypothetical protein
MPEFDAERRREVCPMSKERKLTSGLPKRASHLPYDARRLWKFRRNVMSGMLAVVTGASSEIGYFLPKELAQRGYDLIVCSAGERLAAAAEDFRSSESPLQR